MHREGVHHRGLSPSNIFVDVDEQGSQTLKVGDFGLGNLINRETLAFYKRIDTDLREQQQQHGLSLHLQHRSHQLLQHSPHSSQICFQPGVQPQTSKSVTVEPQNLNDLCSIQSKNSLDNFRTKLLTESGCYLSEQFFQYSLFDRNRNESSNEMSIERLNDVGSQTLTAELIDEKVDIYALG